MLMLKKQLRSNRYSFKVNLLDIPKTCNNGYTAKAFEVVIVYTLLVEIYNPRYVVYKPDISLLLNVKIQGEFLSRISLSKPVFFKSGRPNDLGIRESRNDILTMSLIVATNSAMHSFRIQAGNGRSSLDLAGDSLMTFRISTSVASIKVVSGVPEK